MNVKPGGPGTIADALTPSRDLDRVQLKTTEERRAAEEELRAGIRRVMAGGSAAGRADPGLFCVWCGKGFEYDGERRAMHAEPIEDCPGPPPALPPPPLVLPPPSSRAIRADDPPPARPRRPYDGRDE